MILMIGCVGLWFVVCCWWIEFCIWGCFFSVFCKKFWNFLDWCVDWSEVVVKMLFWIVGVYCFWRDYVWYMVWIVGYFEKWFCFFWVCVSDVVCWWCCLFCVWLWWFDLDFYLIWLFWFGFCFLRFVLLIVY